MNKVSVIMPAYNSSKTISRSIKSVLEQTYDNGVLEGLKTVWHRNGKKDTQGTYVNGKKNGLHESWHDNGVKKKQINISSHLL